MGGAVTSGESRGGAKSDSDDCPHTQVVWAVSEETLELFSLMLSMCKICWGPATHFCVHVCVHLSPLLFSFPPLPFCIPTFLPTLSPQTELPLHLQGHVHS